MPSLYELSNDAILLEEQLDALEIMEDVDSSDKEQAEEIYSTIQRLIQEKSAGIVAIVRNTDMMIDDIDMEIKRLRALKKQKEKRIESIKEYALACMQMQGVKKIETYLGNISIRKGSGKVIIDDIDKLPDEYKRTTVTIEGDRTAIKKAIKDGINVFGAELVFEDSLIIPKAKRSDKND